MSIISLVAGVIAAAGSDPATVTLSGETISGSDGTASPWSSEASIRFLADGRIQKKQTIDGAGGWITIDSATDWIKPGWKSDGVYEVRYTNKVGASGFSTEAAVEDTWIAISTTREWLWVETAEGVDSFTVDFEIRYASGGTLASTTYNFDVDNGLA
jgi:hypothetical protein